MRAKDPGDVRAKLAQGWAWPLNSKKAHYYREGELTSMCGSWMFTGEREDTAHDSADNCARCKKLRAKLAAPQAKKKASQ